MSPIVSIDIRPAVFKFLNDKKRRPQTQFNMSVLKKQEYYHGFLIESESDRSQKCKIDMKPTFNF